MSEESDREKPFICPTSSEPQEESAEPDDAPALPDWDFDDEFDGGDETCGRVIVNLHLYIRNQRPGLRILVISRDPGAPVEIPAWCRMTSNELSGSQHPYYLITLKPHKVRS